MTTPVDFEPHNANYVGGDISGGAMDLWRPFTRPVAPIDPYSTSAKGIYLCRHRHRRVPACMGCVVTSPHEALCEIFFSKRLGA